MAMQSARMAGLEVPSPVFDRISQIFGLGCSATTARRYAYQFNAGATMTAHRGRLAEPPVSGLEAR